MKHLGLLLLVALFIGGCKKDHAVVVKEQATEMGQALLKKDFRTFTKYTYPKIVELMGGKERMATEMETGAKQMEAAGYGFEKITVGEPSKIITEKKELQCTVPQTIVLKVPGGKQTIESTLIGVSGNEGKNWYFIDAAGKTMEEIRGALPNISSQLVLPARKEPVMQKS